MSADAEDASAPGVECSECDRSEAAMRQGSCLVFDSVALAVFCFADPPGVAIHSGLVCVREGAILRPMAPCAHDSQRRLLCESCRARCALSSGCSELVVMADVLRIRDPGGIAQEVGAAVPPTWLLSGWSSPHRSLRRY